MIDVTERNAVEAATILKKFLAEFDSSEVKVKPAKVSNNRALALHYIDARCVMDRLDETVGADGWKDEYTVHPSGSVECRLSVRIAGEWITKADVGSESEQPDAGDRMKAAYSDAFKRAAVKFGIGRFLYRMPQQWMDYDPVKKQIIRPQAQQQKPQPTPVKDNMQLRARHAQAFAQAKTKADCDKVSAAIAADLKAGNISEADRLSLRSVAEQAYARFANAPAKA